MEIINLNSELEHIQKVVEILSEQPDSNYLLLLSGGKSPTNLFKHMSFSFGYPFPKDIAMVDERWGPEKFHASSNENLLRETGLLGRLRWEKSTFHPILSENPSTAKVEAGAYENDLAQLLANYRGRTVAFLGMGLDGHIAGILPDSEPLESNDLVMAYEAEDQYKDRITVTASCMLENFSKTILILDGDEKCGTFSKIMEFESDASEYPVLILKNLQDLTVLCYKKETE